MVYLDYSATTPVNKDVLDSFNKVTCDFIGNANSLHLLGVKGRTLEEQATNQIKDILKINDYDIIYTSGASEANNTVIKGVASMYSNRGKKIITTNLEHSSIYGPLEYLEKYGFEIIKMPTDSDGIVMLDELEKLIDDSTILVTVAAVNSETGILQPINEIGKIVKQNKKCFFHVDMTQSIGKIKMSFNDVDFASMSAHKIYGLKGIGILFKKKNIVIEPLIHGGKSTTKYRSGTPPLALIVSTSKALRLAYSNIEQKYEYVSKLNKKIITKLRGYDKVRINSNDKCIPYIISFSVLGVKPESMQHALEEYEVYISTKSACSGGNDVSLAVLEVTKNSEIAKHSLRISLSHLTSEEDVDKFLFAFDKCYQKMCNLK